MEKIEIIWQVALAIGGVILTVLGALIGWGLKKLIEALWAAVIAVNKLEGKIELLFERTEKMPEMKADINEAHEKIRQHNREILDLKGRN